MPVVTQHCTMLQRNLLYTGITRARKLFFLSGSRRAIGMAVRNNKKTWRFTALGRRMKMWDGRETCVRVEENPQFERDRLNGCLLCKYKVRKTHAWQEIHTLSYR